MQVTLRHRQEVAGLTGSQLNHFIDCRVEFSEEEKAIITTRGLGTQYSITVPPARPTGSGMAMDGLAGGCSRIVGGGFGILGALFVFAPMMAGESVPPMLFMGLGMLAISAVIFGTMITAHTRHNATLTDQSWGLDAFVASPMFTVYAESYDTAKYYDEKIRLELATIKDAIVRNIDIKKTETFEL